MNKCNLMLTIFLSSISSKSIFCLAPQQIARLGKEAQDELKKSAPSFDAVTKNIAQLRAGGRLKLATDLELEMCKKQQQAEVKQHAQQTVILQQEKNKLKQEIDQIKNALAQEQKSKKTVEQNVQTLKTDLQQHKQQLQEMQQRCTGAIQTQETQTKTNQQLRSIVQAQQAQLTNLQAQQITTRKQLEDKIHTLEDENSKLTQQVEEYAQIMPFKEGEIGDVAELAIAEQEVDLKNQLKDTREENEQLKGQYALQQKALEECTKETTSLHGQFIIMKSEIAQLHEALTSLKDQVFNAAKVQAKTTEQEKKKAATELKVRFEDRGGNILRYYEMIEAIKNSFNVALDALNKITQTSAKLQR